MEGIELLLQPWRRDLSTQMSHPRTQTCGRPGASLPSLYPPTMGVPILHQPLPSRVPAASLATQHVTQPCFDHSSSELRSRALEAEHFPGRWELGVFLHGFGQRCSPAGSPAALRLEEAAGLCRDQCPLARQSSRELSWPWERNWELSVGTSNLELSKNW